MEALAIGKVIMIGTGATLALVGGGAALLGFSSAGIAAGSVAAGTQAGIGNVAAGSLFAAAQSAGASGVFTYLGTTGGGALLAGLIL